MGCFCKTALGKLQAALPALDAQDVAATLDAQLVLSLSAWLGARGLPAPPWSPDPAWREAALPSLSMSAQGMATISAIANLRAQVQAQFGLDLLVSAEARMFARLAATLQVRLDATLALTASIAAQGAARSGDARGWQRLAALDVAVAQVELALRAAIFDPASQAYAMPPGWAPFLADLAALLPLIAIGVQLDLDLSLDFSAELSLAIRALLAIELPALPGATLGVMASLSATLSAVASLSASLGAPALQLGFAQAHAMVTARASAVAARLSIQLGIDLSLPGALAALLAGLPSRAFCPSLAATSVVVDIALRMNAQAVASLTWRPPALTAVALLRVGLPVVGLAAQLQASLGITSALSPCLLGCDANAVLSVALGV